MENKILNKIRTALKSVIINKKNYMDYVSLKNVLCVGMSKFDD